jgi:hypothetical protein
MEYLKIVDEKLVVLPDFEEGCVDPILTNYCIGFIRDEKIEFFGAETDEDFIALANHIGGDCETVADAISFINGSGWIAMKDAISL